MASARAILSDDDLKRSSKEELISYIQRLQHEKFSTLHEHGSKMKDVNQRLQTHLLEIRNLKEVNKKLQDDSQELRDLCCFLDDDRQKSRKLSKEWQRFGRYTSSLIKTEVAAHQTKFQEISGELGSMMQANEELKELVIYLDDERAAGRDAGDGSSGETADDSPSQVAADKPDPKSPLTKSLSSDTMSYIQHLEQRIELLEVEVKEYQGKNPWLSTPHIQNAMKVLDIHNSLDKPPSSPGSQMSEEQKNLLRGLCNVAWKSLEETKPPKPTAPRIPQNSRV